ncbi:OLC1v1026272C1 [Oldenlandia corymbosa var. corymbosa]|uniref:OLC1v1026272C1 n=1 Tax=Oldenlandia corymbosa var. corymbosa TaxID=529605 RepID=A0AAV1C810_OLDCO|nr:OLC1v1026272C1 [Oldenlandia corymbosa var. corymbosa]
MESLKKLSEANSPDDGEKIEGMHNAMSLVMLEWQEAGGHLKLVLDTFRECLGKLESKEKYLRVLEESVKQSCWKEFDSRRRWIETGLQRLDEKRLSRNGALREIEIEETQFGKRVEDFLLVEEEIHGALKLKQRQMEEMETEVDSKEGTLRCREDQMDAEEKNLELRLTKVDEMERNVERRKLEIDSKEKVEINH